MNQHIKNLTKTLTHGYRYGVHEMLGWFLSETMVLWGYKPWREVPADAHARIQEAISHYDRAILADEPFKDLLGPLYMELASNGGRQALGQFFTPWPIASMMAQMTIGERAAKDSLTTMIDPACGSGVMMLASLAHILQRDGAEALLHYSATGIDLDAYCARMMAVQMLANCFVHQVQVGEIIVYCGNSLAMRDFEVIAHATAPGVTMPPAAHPERIEQVVRTTNSQPPAKSPTRADQLSLFEL